LPRELGRSGKFWLTMVAYFVGTVIGLWLFEPMAKLYEQIDTAILRWVASWRFEPLTTVMEGLALLSARWALRALRWGTIITLVVVRRWRQLFVFLGAIVAEEMIAYSMTLFIHRPRPFGVETLSQWQGFSMPSRPMASLAVTLVGMAYSLIPHGRYRDAAKWAIAGVLIAVGASRIYLAVDPPSAAVFGGVLGVAIGLTAFRWFAPNDVFPVSYRKGKTAHLDVTGRRADAIATAVRDQLGFQVLEIEPVGLEGSGGSTPLRLRVRADPSADAGATEDLDTGERTLFAKLYAKNHVRADRWYKIGRTILYGALEDETPFSTVRRFVEYEDYTLRLMEDLDLPVPRPYGVVEITPEREYMIVMEFFDGAVEIGEADIGEAVIDQGLGLIRDMWDDGLAHRDVKPANLMVRDQQLKVIDVFFVQVRPSPWRQAVDLANMMLVLGLRSDADTVYERALEYFTPEEIAEAFAATRGVASPTQLRSMLKDDGRDLVDRFRALAPTRPPVRIQRWSLRRLGLTVTVLVGAFVFLGLIISNWTAFA
jgi:membrane-associated phospholipid phosphatase/tRNA A-37 threonylcarbamoyl transferase component Bud32